jgi:hypothetical protein
MGEFQAREVVVEAMRRGGRKSLGTKQACLRTTLGLGNATPVQLFELLELSPWGNKKPLSKSTQSLNLSLYNRLRALRGMHAGSLTVRICTGRTRSASVWHIPER